MQMLHDPTMAPIPSASRTGQFHQRDMLRRSTVVITLSVAPNSDDWAELVTRTGELTTGPYDWSEEVAAITAPTLVIVGDADSVVPEHTVALFRLLGGGVVGDLAPLPAAQLAVLPGTAHSAVLFRTDLLVPIITGFLDAPMPEAE